MLKNFLVKALVIFIAILFIYTAISKLLDIKTFQDALEQSILIPDEWIVTISILIPIIELIIAVCLFWDKTYLYALISATALMFVFTVYIFILFRYSPSTPCTCGGIVSSLSWEYHLALNATLTLLLFTTTFHTMKKYTTILTACLFMLFLNSAPSYAQMSFQKSFFVKDTGNRSIPYPIFRYTKKSKTSTKLLEIRGNEAGVIDLSTLGAKDTLMIELGAVGYESFRDTVVVNTLYVKTIQLQLKEEVLKQVEVSSSSKKVRLHPDAVEFNWNKYKIDNTSSIVKTIAKLPFIMNTSSDPNNPVLKGIGGKNIIVYLNGRRLNDMELRAIPSSMVNKATLVHFPSAMDGGDNDAVLYLTSAFFAYQYAFSELTANGDVLGGTNGISLQHRGAFKKGLWSGNHLLNFGAFASADAIRDRKLNDVLIEQSTSMNNTSRNFSGLGILTREGLDGSLTTIGTTLNISKAKGDNAINRLGANPNLFSEGVGEYVSSSVFLGWKKTDKKGRSWLLNSAIDYLPYSANLFTLHDSLHTFNLTSNQHDNRIVGGISGRLLGKKIRFAENDFTHSFQLGYNYTMNQATYAGSRPENKYQTQESALFAALQAKLTNNKYSIEGSILGNYSIQYGYKIANYTNAYVYPRLVSSYKINEKNTVSLSLSARTYRPSVGMFVDDSLYKSNWTASQGNNQLKSEVSYNAELLYSFSGENVSSSVSFRHANYQNGLVREFVPHATDHSLYISKWINDDYWRNTLSAMLNVDFTQSFSVKVNASLVQYHFNDKRLTGLYKNGWYAFGSLAANYTHGNHELSLSSKWYNNVVSFMSNTERLPSVSFDYEIKLLKNLRGAISVRDIFNTSNQSYTNYFYGVSSSYNRLGRTLGISLTWTIGDMFPTKAAGGSANDALLNDQKRTQ